MTSHIDPLARLDQLIAERSLLKHPFYQAWTAGTLPKEALVDYARQYYHHVAAFPTYLSAVHSVTGSQPTRRLILQNLMDEEAGSPNHPELWLTFAGSLGLTREMVEEVELYPETRRLIDAFQSVCRSSTLEGLTALYAYESQIPAVSESKIAGLRKHYGLNDPKGLAYFEVHIEADKEHSAVEKRLLSDYITGTETTQAQSAASGVLDALWGMLDGVCIRNGVAC